MIAYSVSQRTQEIGIRLALGADAGAVVRMVVRQGMTLVAALMFSCGLAEERERKATQAAQAVKAQEAAERQRRIEADQLARAEALRARAELEALRSQLNPHFILNTIHALMGLVRCDAEPGRGRQRRPP